MNGNGSHLWMGMGHKENIFTCKNQVDESVKGMCIHHKVFQCRVNIDDGKNIPEPNVAKDGRSELVFFPVFTTPSQYPYKILKWTHNKLRWSLPFCGIKQYSILILCERRKRDTQFKLYSIGHIDTNQLITTRKLILVSTNFFSFRFHVIYSEWKKYKFVQLI